LEKIPCDDGWSQSGGLTADGGAVGQFAGFEVLLVADVSDGEIECAVNCGDRITLGLPKPEVDHLQHGSSLQALLVESVNGTKDSARFGA
jgi:hypothetical protein